MMYYTTVAGWMLDYFFKFLTGRFTGLTPDAVGPACSAMRWPTPASMVLWMVVISRAGLPRLPEWVCRSGLERIGKWMMGALLVLILVLVAHSFVLPGVKEGLAFYLLPDWQRACEQGPWQRHHRRDEPVLLHFKPGHCRHGNFRQLHGAAALP